MNESTTGGHGVVFHVTTAVGATVVLRNVINLRAELGGVAVEVVTQGAGLDLVLTATGPRPELAELVAGVTFSACRKTLNSRGLSEPDLANGVGIVPAGVARATQLQWSGYAYIRP